MANLRFLTAGESHGPCLTAIVEGIPAGVRLSLPEMNHDLARRQQGYGRGGRMKIETDQLRILSGVRFGETLGSPVTLEITNHDWVNWEKRMAAFGAPFGELVTAARPGHADLTGIRKYDREDIRDILERASARETAARVAIGALAKQFLKACGIEVVSHVTNIGGIAVDAAKIDTKQIHGTISELNCYDSIAEKDMESKIREAKAAGDTLGGIFEVVVHGVPLGLGSHIQWDNRLDGRLAGAMMSIQAIKGVEFGAGFNYAAMPGSLAHDELFYNEAKKVYRKTNHAGGLEGGMSNGEDILIRAVMKPIPTLMKPLHSVDIATHEAVLASKERSDVCAVSAASVVGEAMTAIVIAQAVVEKFGGDAMADVLESIANYQQRIQEE